MPVFFLISFLLSVDSLRIGGKKLSIRLLRLWIPQVTWAFIYWIIHQICKLESYNNWKDLGWQLLMGCSRNLNPPMWYQFDLILLTVLFAILFKIMFSKRIYFFFIIFIGCLVFQYSGINYRLFSRYVYEVKYPLGRIVEMLPYACLGIGINELRIFEKIKSNKIISQVVLIIFCVLGIVVDNICKPKGFGYQGLQWITLGSICVINLYICPFDKISVKVKKVLVIISEYTLGIYCMHFGVGQILNGIFTKLNWETGTFVECILIYIICFVNAMIIAKIPLKSFKCIVV